MKIILWIVFLLAVGIAFFTVQNSTASPVTMKFLFWQFDTSLTYTILGSVGAGMLIIFLLWIPTYIKASFRLRNLKKKIELLEGRMKEQIQTAGPRTP
jgi:uncharacterized integral membrane protein